MHYKWKEIRAFLDEAPPFDVEPAHHLRKNPIIMKMAEDVEALYQLRDNDLKIINRLERTVDTQGAFLAFGGMALVGTGAYAFVLWNEKRKRARAVERGEIL